MTGRGDGIQMLQKTSEAAEEEIEKYGDTLVFPAEQTEQNIFHCNKRTCWEWSH